MAAGSKWHNGQLWDYGERGGRDGGLGGDGWKQPREGAVQVAHSPMRTPPAALLPAALSQTVLPAGPSRRPSRLDPTPHPAPPRPGPPAVFDVDVQEGAAPLKLALNRGDNPYLVADRFLEEHGLPATYKWVAPACCCRGCCQGSRGQGGWAARGGRSGGRWAWVHAAAAGTAAGCKVGPPL